MALFEKEHLMKRLIYFHYNEVNIYLRSTVKFFELVSHTTSTCESEKSP